MEDDVFFMDESDHPCRLKCEGWQHGHRAGVRKNEMDHLNDPWLGPMIGKVWEKLLELEKNRVARLQAAAIELLEALPDTILHDNAIKVLELRNAMEVLSDD